MKKVLVLLVTVLLALPFSGCSASNDGNGSSDTSASDENYVFDLKEDDRTVIWKLSNQTYVATHDGKTVTDFTVYMDAYDAQTAKEIVADAVTDGKPSDKEYRSVRQKGKYIVCEYNPEYFPYRDYDSVIAAKKNAEKSDAVTSAATPAQ